MNLQPMKLLIIEDDVDDCKYDYEYHKWAHIILWFNYTIPVFASSFAAVDVCKGITKTAEQRILPVIQP